ncbi:hypothetical protein D3C80_1338420 [compost metagenome]
MRALVARGCLAAEGCLQHRLVVAVISGKVDLVIDRVADHIAVALGPHQRTYRKLDANRR